jgi:MFS family permease
VLDVLRNRDFRLLFVGGLVSSLGDWFLFIALPFYVYSLTGSTLATGGTFIAETLPSILFGSLAGVFVDRWDRRRTMIVADLLRGALILGLLLVRSPGTVWIVFAVTFVQSTIGQFFNPAKEALIPRLVGEDELLAANSLSSTSIQLTMLVGPLLGGGSLALFGIATGVAVDSASFIFSAVMAALVVAPVSAPTQIAQRVAEASAVGRVIRDYRQGLYLMRKNAVVLALLLAMGIGAVGQGLINVQLIPWTKDVLRGDAFVLGWIASSQGIGGMIGALTLGSIGQKFSPTRVMATGLIVCGVFVVAAVSTTVLPLVCFLVGLAGVAIVAFMVRLQTLLQLAVTDKYRGRVLGAYGTTQSALLLVGMALSGAVGGMLGSVSTLELAGVLYALGGVATAFVLPRALRSAPSTTPEAR